jgi:hypothetical protein
MIIKYDHKILSIYSQESPFEVKTEVLYDTFLTFEVPAEKFISQ